MAGHGTARFGLDRPVDLRHTLGELRTGRGDPTIRLDPTAVLRAFHSPAGPACLHVRITDGTVEAEAWGAGADWALEHVPGLVGRHDDVDSFTPRHPAVVRAHRRRPGLRIARTGLVGDVLVQTILGQKVTGVEASRAWAGCVRRWGRPAPGPGDVRLPPPPEELATRPYWAWHRLGVERRRAETIARACSRIDRLQEAVTMPRQQARRRLTALPGLGPWTAAIVMRHAMGDPDTVEVGDFHLKNTVAWNLAGEPRGTDQRMLELLAPFAGHRGRVVMLLESAGQRAPRYGPRRRPGRIATL